MGPIGIPSLHHPSYQVSHTLHVNPFYLRASPIYPYAQVMPEMHLYLFYAF